MTTHPTLPSLSADPSQLEQRVRQVLAQGRPDAARPMLRVLRGLGALPSVLAELDARLLMATGHLHQAYEALTRAIGAMPGVAGLHACRAEILIRLDDPAGSLADAAEAVVLAPGDADAKALLGIALIEAGRPGEAAHCLAEALEAQPGASSYRLAYAEALHRSDRSDDAAFVLRDGTRLQPRDLALRRAAMMHAVRAGKFGEAALIGEGARADWVVDAAVLGLLAHALGALGRHREASAAYADASRLDPEDPYVRHLAAAGGALPAGPRAPVDYVRTVFNGYAERFDSHLLSLGYRLPGLFRAELAGLEGPRGPVTDLGCGTGLLAVACDDLVGPWTGIDLSPAMLAQAANRNLYAHLVEGDLVEAMDRLPQTATVLAADVLCYFGALDGVLSAMRRHLRPGGHAVLSVEQGPATFDIGPHGRFRHSPKYLREAARAASFDVVAIRPETLRWEGGDPVPGLIATLQAPL